MSPNLTTHYVNQYGNIVSLLLQEKGRKFYHCVMHGTHVGEGAAPVNQIGKVEMIDDSGRFGPMPRVDATTDRRWVYPVDKQLPQLIDPKDDLRMLTDPRSQYAQNGMNAVARAEDREIIRALLGDARTGKSGGTTTTFPTSVNTNVVAVDVGAGSATGMNNEKLLRAMELLMTNNVELDREDCYVAMSPRQYKEMFNDTTIISGDFNDQMPISKGYIREHLGMKIVVSTLLETDDSSYRRCICWVKSGVHCGTWRAPIHTVSQRHDLESEPWQIYHRMTIGATRIEEGRVIEIKCSEA